jgi:hypothetical protein
MLKTKFIKSVKKATKSSTKSLSS